MILTEGNFYYTENGIERCHWCTVCGKPELVTPKGKVIAPVPTYEEYQALKENLDIAVKALENILKDTPSCYRSKGWCPLNSPDGECLISFETCFVKKTVEALAKIKGYK